MLLITRSQAQTLSEAQIYLKHWEGYKLTPYHCPSGNLTVGIGHKLKREEIKTKYTDFEVYRFFVWDYAIAKEVAEKTFKNFNSHPEDVKLVLISIIFTVGPKGITKFKNLIIALQYKSYEVAAIELADSKWFYQVGATRANHHYRTLKYAKARI